MIREVKTVNGIVRGLPAADPRITAFKGIPFAAPPVGKNRWRAPQPCENWDGVLEAYQFAPISMQDTPGLGTDIYCREWHVDPDIPMSEDCLYLNVWTNAKSPDEKLPVMVWFYGGGLQWGYPAEMEFDGERIARRGVVFVSVNYRINSFGFLAHPQITAEQPDAPANFGHLDQQAGVRWVKENIAAFGGDPDNITITGQSAGGGSVMSQLTCPSNEGLFQKAIIMSGMIRSPYGIGGVGMAKKLAEAEQDGVEFFKCLGVETLEEARELDPKYIVEKYAEFRGPMMGPGMRMFMTVQDDLFCFGDSVKLMLQNKHLQVPIMSGNTKDEFPSMMFAESKEDFEKKVREIFGERADRFLAHPEVYNTPDGKMYGLVPGIEATVKSVFAENKRLGNEQNNYYYRFDADIPGWDNPGTFHSVDLWFFFETLAKCWRPFEGRHYDLARYMCNYMTNFIKTGDPNGQDANGKDMPQWNPYTPEKPCEITFRTDGLVVKEEAESDLMSVLIDQTTATLRD